MAEKPRYKMIPIGAALGAIIGSLFARTHIQDLLNEENVSMTVKEALISGVGGEYMLLQMIYWSSCSVLITAFALPFIGSYLGELKSFFQHGPGEPN